MKDWINEVWKHQLDAFCQPSMLLLDGFCRHTMPGVKARIHCSSDLVVILGGTTKVLQFLGVTINRLFKVVFLHAYNQWVTATNYNLTPSRRMKCASLPTVCESAYVKLCIPFQPR